MNLAVVPEARTLAVRGPVLPAAELAAEVRALLEVGAVYVKSGLLPASVRTPEAAVVIMLMARKLGLDESTAFRSIYVVEGKPALSAQLMLALVEREYGPVVRVVTSTDTEAVIEVQRGGRQTRYAWTMADAQRAGLAGKDNWRKYPRQMLRARAIADAVRTEYPATTLGLYTPEELEAPEVAEPTGGYTVIGPRELAAAPSEPEPEPTGDWAPLEHTTWADVPRPEPDPADRATERQLAAIRAHLQRIGEANEAAVAGSLGAAALEDLSREAASTLVGQLSREPNAAE